MRIIENFLPENNFRFIQTLLMSNNFPYYRQEWVGTPDDISLTSLLTHLLIYDGEKKTDEAFQKIIMEPIANKLRQENNSLNIVRAKVNLYPYQNEHMKSTYHVDQDIEHKVLLLPINTNNGYTEFESGTRFQSIENTAIIFDGNLKHRSVSQTDNSAKINININYYNEA